MALTNSVDKDTKQKKQHEKTKFMTGAAMDVPVGILYFKKLMMKAKVDSRAMASHIRKNLGSLDTYMYTTANCNILTFNDYAHDPLAALTAHGETTHDLLNSLFNAYARVDCEEFRDFIKGARRDWERNRCDYDPEILMNECNGEYCCLFLLS
jgi:hypothetical protein